MRRMKTGTWRRRLVLAICPVWLAIAAGLPSSAIHALPQNINGGIQLNTVDSKTDGVHRTSINQRYSLHWTKRFLPYLTARASVNYDRFGTQTAETGRMWRQHIQPTGELGWDHPYFSAAATYNRRESSSRDDRTSRAWRRRCTSSRSSSSSG